MAAKYFTHKPPSIRSIDTYVDLRGGNENFFYLGRGGGGEKGLSLLLHSKLRAKKKEEELGGTKK